MGLVWVGGIWEEREPWEGEKSGERAQRGEGGAPALNLTRATRDPLFGRSGRLGGVGEVGRSGKAGRMGRDGGVGRSEWAGVGEFTNQSITSPSINDAINQSAID